MPRLVVKPPTVIFFALLMFADRSALSLMPVLAALVHELGHLVAMQMFGCGIGSMEITAFGAEIRAPLGFQSALQAVAVYGAGATANILCAAVVMASGMAGECAELFAACNLVLAGINLLPIRVLDGGCILEIIATRVTPLRAATIADTVSGIFLSVLWLVCSYLMLAFGTNLSLMLFCLYLFFELYLM